MIVFQLISIVRTQLLLKYQLKTVVKQFHTKLISSMLCTWLPLQESPKHCKLCPLLLHLTHDLPLKEARPPNGTQCIEAALFIMDQLLLRIRKDFGITSMRFLSLFLKTQQL